MDLRNEKERDPVAVNPVVIDHITKVLVYYCRGVHI